MVLRRQIFSCTIPVPFLSLKLAKVMKRIKMMKVTEVMDNGGGSGSEDDPGERSETGANNGTGECRVDGGAGCGSASNHSGGASIGNGGGEKLWTTINILMDIGWEILVVGIEETRAHLIALRQEKLSLKNRFEEGYDLYDPAYVAWLEVTHPEAVPAD